uniref:Uncharacterized protein n=1 Tax=Labrus bergylta TaxID=56723 RepID=A0A3Q3E7P1_9LABR
FQMADSVVRALYGKATSLTLSSKKMKKVPECISRLTNLSVLLLNNNSISCLPAELLSLQHLSELNLGNNALKEVPAVLGHLESLKKLYLFSNQIRAVLGRLEHLSVLDNELEEVPAELGHLTRLTVINLTYNSLSRLPQQLYQCKELTKLHVARNKLSSLPEVSDQGIGALSKLQVLDVAGNKLSMFPVGVRYTELAARRVLREDRNKSSLVHRMLPLHPFLTAMLANSSCCAVCLDPFLTTWLECVHFISLKKTIPVRALLCSYKCFNEGGHSYYGVVSR